MLLSNLSIGYDLYYFRIPNLEEERLYRKYFLEYESRVGKKK